MIRFLLNRVPRPVLQRLARLAMPVARIFYAGRRFECPVCGARLRRFLPYGYVDVRRGALCPACLSLERHRLLWLWIARETDILQGDKKFLHIAPEPCFAAKFEKIYAKTDTNRRNPEVQVALCGGAKGEAGVSAGARYVTADLESPLAGVKVDVQAIPFADGAFDVVMCNHVLEHVADDGRAMRELYRVTKPGGLGILLSPVDESREHTFEDDRVTDPAERTKIFGQYDHRRIYGRDYAARLASAGWSVEKIDYLRALTDAEKERFGLRKEPLYICSKVGTICSKVGTPTAI